MVSIDLGKILMASSTMSKLLDMDLEGLSYLDRYTVDECIKAGECNNVSSLISKLG